MRAGVELRRGRDPHRPVRSRGGARRTSASGALSQPRPRGGLRVDVLHRVDGITVDGVLVIEWKRLPYLGSSELGAWRVMSRAYAARDMHR
jgi:hypothetical protein